MSKIDLIYKAIKAGVSAPKIIAKYGKKAYNAAKKGIKEVDRVDKEVGNKPPTSTLLKMGIPSVVGMPLIEPIDKYLTKRKKKKEVLKKAEQKKQRTESRKAQRGVRSGERGYKGLKSGGSVNSRAIAKKYFRGGLV
jgi:hypothetical protein